MGFHPAWKYQAVIELVVDAGMLKKEFDRSERMAEVRERMTAALGQSSSAGTPDTDASARFVERAFDRTYRR